MYRHARMWTMVFCVMGGAWASSPARADNAPQTDAARASNALDLRIHPGDATARTASLTAPQTDTDEEMTLSASDELSWDLAGPYEMRSADPEEHGVVELKNIFGWSTTKGESDEFEYEFEVEWGVAENHELIFEVPVEVGDGRVDGNGDAEIGWHWRLWKEQDWLPAFGMRNFVRVPTGIESAGVDYEWIGLFTKTIIPGTLRFDANPFIKSVNGNNEEEARHFLWGGSFGLDWRVNDELVLVGLYRYETGELEGTRDNHTLQFGGEWEFMEHNEIGFSAEVGLDGDDNGPALGAMISYIYSF